MFKRIERARDTRNCLLLLLLLLGADDADE
jgi:hypothetical protein